VAKFLLFLSLSVSVFFLSLFLCLVLVCGFCCSSVLFFSHTYLGISRKGHEEYLGNDDKNNIQMTRIIYVYCLTMHPALDSIGQRKLYDVHS
jgi:hypothetical protein